MITLFKSPTRRKIEKRIEQIERIKTMNVIDRGRMVKHHLRSSAEMTRLDIELKALKRIIEK